MSDTRDEYQDSLNVIKESIESYVNDAERGMTVKSAALRARKTSVQLAKLMKDFRSVSVRNDKGNVKKRTPKEA